MTDKTNPYKVPTTGHVWDDNLAELLNPPPKWWMIGLYASILVVILYGVFYPMWPGVTGYTKGFLGWTSIGEFKQDLADLDTKRAKFEEGIAANDEKAILNDSALLSYAKNSAKVLFGDNCAACHGSKGTGNANFPVLADDDWLYGGDLESIKASITGGRQGVMTAHRVEQVSDTELDELANAIFEGKPTSTPLFQEKACFACHGMDGAGMHVMGSANLTDGIWRFASANGTTTLDDIKYTIRHGVNDPSDPLTRNAVMPKFEGSKLSESDIKKLTVYVYSLVGREQGQQ